MATVRSVTAAAQASQAFDPPTLVAQMDGARSAGEFWQALGIAPGQAHSYGKAAIVGEHGELEHAAAILHPKLGAPLRKAVEKGALAKLEKMSAERDKAIGDFGDFEMKAREDLDNAKAATAAALKALGEAQAKIDELSKAKESA